MDTIYISIFTSLIASFLFWIFFTFIPTRKKRSEMRKILNYDIYSISLKLLFFLDIPLEKRSIRPAYPRMKIVSNLITESEYDLMLQNKCLNESYMYDEMKDYMIPIGNELEEQANKIINDIEKISYYHNFMSAEEIILLKRIKEKLSIYSYTDTAESKIGETIYRPLNPNLAYMAKNFKALNDLYYKLHTLTFEYRDIDKSLMNDFEVDPYVAKSQISYEKGNYTKAYIYAILITRNSAKNSLIFMSLYKLNKFDLAFKYLKKYINDSNLLPVNLRNTFQDSYKDERVIDILSTKYTDVQIKEMVDYFEKEKELIHSLRERLEKIKLYYKNKTGI